MTEKLKGREVFERIVKVTKEKEVKTQSEKMVKLMEEMGELSVAHLQKKSLKGKGSKTDKEVHENFLEEACDCVIILQSILAAEGFDYDEYLTKMSEKLSKWEDVAAKIAKMRKEG
jgi:hypothetical protein